MLFTGCWFLKAQHALPAWPENRYTPYPFLHTEFNTLQFYDRKLAEPVFLKLNNAANKRINLLYIGDSQVNCDRVFSLLMAMQAEAWFFHILPPEPMLPLIMLPHTPVAGFIQKTLRRHPSCPWVSAA